ncbi:AAA family ATPase [Chitinibacter sp. SCUT-21]|uniref:ATP-binding protein n=1 Tax=Chitinibacter sp. SCUT-21 TaxID=2970891 RepID=UPI0035A5C977
MDKQTLPDWATEIRERYQAGEASVFILHGNVFDQYLLGNQLCQMQQVLDQLLQKKAGVFELTLAQGIRTVRAAPSIKPPSGDDRSLMGAFDYLENQMQAQNANIGLIVPYAETIFPAAETHALSFDERGAITTLHRWSLAAELDAADSIVILVAESLSTLAPALLSNPRIVAIDIALPNLSLRQQALSVQAAGMSSDEISRIAAHTAGLRLVQIGSIVSQGAQTNTLAEQERYALILNLLKDSADAEARAQTYTKVTAGMSPQAIQKLIAPQQSSPQQEDAFLTIIQQRKREILEKECAGLIEIIQPKHDLSVVGGNQAIRDELMRIAQTLRANDLQRAPMGVLAVGPMGSGKTFVINAFLKSAGLTGVMLKNFRSQWVGATETNLERVLSLLKVMGPVALIIDEGDRSFGSRSEDNDGGTSSRVIARLKTFMSDTDNRGNVLTILMTNRPDKLDGDIKRPGRLDVKIPFFYAQTVAERSLILQSLLKRHAIAFDASAGSLDELGESIANYSNADLEAVVLLAASLFETQPVTLSTPLLQQAANDFIRPNNAQMIRMMELLAVFESSRRSWLPTTMKSADLTELRAELSQLSTLLN